MFQNKIDRAKTFTLLHISYCVISALALVISYAINGFTVENWKSSDGASLFYIPLMLIVYFCFCFAWCINDRIALLAISKKKHKLLKYHLNFAITIMIFSAPILGCVAYLFTYVGLRSGWDLMQAFNCRDAAWYLISSSVMMFFGTLMSSFLSYYWYQIKKEFSTLVTSTPNDQADIISIVCNMVICQKKPNQNTH